jgi:predicted Zn-dependent protease
MAAKKARICPACGIRNKPTWTVCAGCGETLSDEPTAIQSAEPARSEGAGESGFPWVAAVGGVVLITAGYFGFQALQGSDSAQQATPAPQQAPAAAQAGTAAAGATAPGSTSEPSYIRGAALLAAGDAAGAVPLLADAVAEEPDNPRARFAYASALWITQRQEEAIDEYRVAVDLSPRTAQYRGDLARALHTTGQTDEAITEFEGAVILASRDSTLLRDFAQALSDAGQSERAAVLLERVTSRDSQNATAQRQLAMNLERTGDLDGAERAYRKVLEGVPGEHYSRGLLADVLFRQERGDEAVQIMRDGIDATPDAAVLHRGLASLLERTGDISEAVTEYRAYARLAPDQLDAQEMLERADRLERQP